VDTQNKLYDTGELNTDIGYCMLHDVKR